MTNLKYGSSGEEVTKLQNALISAGYDVGSTGADGVYGTNTQAAVKAYQKANGLSVDGIAGENTLNSLYGTNTTSSTPASGTTTNTATTTTTPEASTTPSTTSGFKYNEFTYEDYTPSDAVNQANALLQQQQANNPGSYSPIWKDEADSYLSQYQNRDQFSYNVNEDALYNQYKDNYIRQGQMAMMDTMGQAAALTGGYGNSYAQSVGQQAYQGYLQELNNVVPELWQLARENYDREGQDLLTMYDLYMNKENQEYNQYQDSMDRWYQEMNRLQDNYNTLYNQEYGKWADKLNLDYGMYRDQIADKQWQAEFDEAKRRYDQEWELANGGKKTNSNPNPNPGGNYTANPGWSEEKIKRFQDAHGLTVDGKWGPQTAAAYDKDPNWADPGEQGTLSREGQAFLNKLPYAHAGSGEQWKKHVDKALESSNLSDADKKEIIKRLNLFD